jgi:hypothetical protein
MVEVFRKPVAICSVLPELEHQTTSEEISQFVAAEKMSVEQRVSHLGLSLRLATEQDIEAMGEFQKSRFAKETLLEDPYVLFRIVRFGFAPLIVSSDGRIVGCNICQAYNDPDSTLWGMRNSVDSSVSGANLAADLAYYSSLIGMERGARFRRGFVSPGNFASAVNSLNHVGFIAESLKVNVPGHQGPRFILALPLTPAGVKNNRIDPEKIGVFMKAHRADRDYLTLPVCDLERLVQTYSETPFKVVAFLKAGADRAEHEFFALREDNLGFPGK